MKAEIRQLTNEEYHASEGISASGIKLLLKCPKKYHWQYILGNREGGSTEALKFGSGLHTLLLEPKKFEEEYIVLDEMPRKNSNAYKELIEKNSGKTILKRDEYNQMLGMSQAFTESDNSHLILSDDCMIEQSIFWKDEETGILLKSRPDFVNHEAKIIFDLKTTNDASFDGFRKSKLSYEYDIQAYTQQLAVYCLTGEMYLVCHIAIEKEAPYIVKGWEVTEPEFTMGEFKLRKALQYYNDCMRLNKWRGYTSHALWLAAEGKEKIEKNPLPAWYENKFNEEGIRNE